MAGQFDKVKRYLMQEAQISQHLHEYVKAHCKRFSDDDLRTSLVDEDIIGATGFASLLSNDGTVRNQDVVVSILKSLAIVDMFGDGISVLLNALAKGAPISRLGYATLLETIDTAIDDAEFLDPLADISGEEAKRKYAKRDANIIWALIYSRDSDLDSVIAHRPAYFPEPAFCKLVQAELETAHDAGIDVTELAHDSDDANAWKVAVADEGRKRITAAMRKRCELAGEDYEDNLEMAHLRAARSCIVEMARVSGYDLASGANKGGGTA